MSDDRTRHEDVVLDGGTDVEEQGDDGSAPDHLFGGSQNPEIADSMADGTHDLLLEVIRRRPLLCSLESGSASTSDILESVDMSRSTVHRAINSLMEWGVVEESGGEYQLTSVGEIVTKESEAFATRTAAARSLDQFLNAINGHADAVPIEHFTDSTVVRRNARQPHATIHRIIEFIERADSLRMFSTVISPVYVDVGYREMMDGMEIEAIFDREVAEIMIQQYPEKAYETMTSGNFDVYSHEGLPFELFISEEKVGMAAHNDNGNAEILIECADSAAVEWAENLYEEHLSAADGVTP